VKPIFFRTTPIVLQFAMIIAMVAIFPVSAAATLIAGQATSYLEGVQIVEKAQIQIDTSDLWIFPGLRGIDGESLGIIPLPVRDNLICGSPLDVDHSEETADTIGTDNGM